MTGRGVQQLETWARPDCEPQLACYVCQGASGLDAEFCRHCRAPLALAFEAEIRQAALHMLAVIGPSTCGKTVYLGMLTDLLSRQRGKLQVLARGAFSVSLQQQILSALAEGAQIDGIADGLGISERSVREYIARARAKLGARTRTEAVARALMMGMIDPAT